MFTGIIQTVGTLNGVEELGGAEGDVRFLVDANGLAPAALALGASVAVNGVCLTVAARDGAVFAADLSRETLGATTLGDLGAGDRLNLEPALRTGDSLGGHFVSGHVDGVGEVISRESDARSERLRIAFPAQLGRYIARKGSMTVDGVSLTVNDVTARDFGVNLVPHTLARTICDNYGPATRVNLEVDLLARYLERLQHPENGQ